MLGNRQPEIPSSTRPLAQASCIGFYVLGFATALQPILIEIPSIQQIATQYELAVLTQKQIIATGIALIAFTAAIIGADFIIKIQMVIFVILSISVGAILLSPFFNIEMNAESVFQALPNFSGTEAGALALGKFLETSGIETRVFDWSRTAAGKPESFDLVVIAGPGRRASLAGAHLDFEAPVLGLGPYACRVFGKFKLKHGHPYT